MLELISVLMSAYNESELELKSSIYSILNQTHDRIELILVNDNPENKIIDRIITEISDERIIYIKNEKNMGLVASLNRGLMYANGDYIARMDADDISEKTRLEKQLECLKEGDYDVIGCAINYIDESGRNLNRVDYFPTDGKKIIRRNKWKQCVAHPTFFLKKSVYDTLNGYRNISYCEDYDFICRCIASGFKIGNSPETLLNYRIRRNSITQKNLYEQKVRSYYIGHLGTEILNLQESEVLTYFSSNDYKKELELCKRYFEGKNELMSGNIISGIKKICNKYLIYALMRKMYE